MTAVNIRVGSSYSQHETRMELMPTGPVSAHICQTLSPARKQFFFLLYCLMRWVEGQRCPLLPVHLFIQAVGDFERQTAMGRLWKPKEIFFIFSRPGPEHWFSVQNKQFQSYLPCWYECDNIEQRGAIMISFQMAASPFIFAHCQRLIWSGVSSGME